MGSDALRIICRRVVMPLTFDCRLGGGASLGERTPSHASWVNLAHYVPYSDANGDNTSSCVALIA
jgi:hypothetical protein